MQKIQIRNVDNSELKENSKERNSCIYGHRDERGKAIKNVV